MGHKASGGGGGLVQGSGGSSIPSGVSVAVGDVVSSGGGGGELEIRVPQRKSSVRALSWGNEVRVGASPDPANTQLLARRSLISSSTLFQNRASCSFSAANIRTVLTDVTISVTMAPDFTLMDCTCRAWE